MPCLGYLVAARPSIYGPSAAAAAGGSACSSAVSIYGADWLTSIPWPAIVLLTTPTKTIIAIVLLK